MLRACLLGTAFTVGATSSGDAAMPGDRYARVFDAADRLARRGRFARAARLLEQALPDYPQDYALALQAAWMRFGAQHYRRAAAHYRRAIELSRGSIDSRLGLAWSLLYDGYQREAVSQLEQLALVRPDHAGVSAALQAGRARPVVATYVWGSGTAHAYGNLAALRGGVGGQGGLSLRILEHGLLGGSYGYARIFTDPDVTTTRAGSNGGGSGGPGGSGASREADTAIDQHQVHVHVGAAWPVAGGLVQYAYLAGDAIVSDLHVVGTSLRYSPLGDIVLETSVAFGAAGTVPRFAPSWRIPLGGPFWVRPLLALQVVRDRVLPAGTVTAGVQGRPGALWLGGKYGRERSPAYLESPVVFNLPGEIQWGAWAGGRIQLPAGFGLLAAYEVHGLKIDTLATPTSSASQAHYVTLGLDWRAY